MATGSAAWWTPTRSERRATGRPARISRQPSRLTASASPPQRSDSFTQCSQCSRCCCPSRPSSPTASLASFAQ
ncbi:ATPase P (plasmid) [Halanaeroarchaeum sulfurireducens]|uniref:ATPase P n=1 Tax=Halanaeroarchaeum sulfurireducens TaxID=1604004 RepID=A0A0N9N5S6_9EURY|nr:ATPase P [Halanaeroarchaeum sulfurireducens]